VKKKFLAFPVFDDAMAEEIKPTPAVTPSPLVNPPPEDKRRDPKKNQNKSESEQKEDDDTTKRKQQGLFDEYV
jgi:hypothetical protein